MASYLTIGKHKSIFLQGLKETAADPGELHEIRWTDINPQAKTLALNRPVKGHKARIINISNELIERLNTLPKTSPRIFQGNIYSRRRSFHDQRQIAARKFNNPRLLEINFTTFRHWKATMEYHKTRDILHVMKILGHRNIKNTLIYTQLMEFRDDEYISKVAQTTEEARQLTEAGFEYICTTPENLMLFRKRK